MSGTTRSKMEKRKQCKKCCLLVCKDPGKSMFPSDAQSLLFYVHDPDQLVGVPSAGWRTLGRLAYPRQVGIPSAGWRTLGRLAYPRQVSVPSAGWRTLGRLAYPRQVGVPSAGRLFLRSASSSLSRFRQSLIDTRKSCLH